MEKLQLDYLYGVYKFNNNIEDIRRKKLNIGNI